MHQLIYVKQRKTWLDWGFKQLLSKVQNQPWLAGKCYRKLCKRLWERWWGPRFEREGSKKINDLYTGNFWKMFNTTWWKMDDGYEKEISEIFSFNN